LMPYFTRAKENGAKIIVIDPRRTGTAELADLHLKVRPGTDALLASAMLKVIVEEGAVDEAFIQNRTTGFHSVLQQLGSINISDVAKETGIAEREIRLAASLYGTVSTGMIFT